MRDGRDVPAVHHFAGEVHQPDPGGRVGLRRRSHHVQRLDYASLVGRLRAEDRPMGRLPR